MYKSTCQKIFEVIGTTLAVLLFIGFIAIILYGATTDTDNNNIIYTPSGIIEKVEVDGHTYLKSNGTLTHSESCACKQQ
jgi:hypothetical protein